MEKKGPTSKHDRRGVENDKKESKTSHKSVATRRFVGEKSGSVSMAYPKRRPKTSVYSDKSVQAETKARASLMLEFLDELASSPIPPRTAEEIEADVHAERNAWDE